MNYEKVIRGIMKFINEEIYKNLNDWQEILARIIVGRIDTAALKDVLMNNTFVKSFGIVDANGNVDVNGLICDLKKQIESKGKLSITISMLGTFTFTTADVDKLHRMIMEA